MQFQRTIQKSLEKALSRRKVVILYGARQVGKTTLVKKIIKDSSDTALFLNCDEPDIRDLLTQKTSTELKWLVGDNRLVVIDEAQRVRNIGLTLKLLIDNFPQVQVLATGSSSFELSNHVKEPLTGRKIEFQLYPLTMAELSQTYSDLEIGRLLGNILRYGLYPEVATSQETEAVRVINEIAQSYLYKDVLEYQTLKKPEVLEKLLQALALQVGNEVSYTELSNLLGVDKMTVEKYVGLLEKTFIIFPLRPFSRNLRKEIGKKRKIYFFDLGIRNSIIRNFNPMDLRNDVGAMWENFLMAERMKANAARQAQINQYFWRTYDKKEIDLVEEGGGTLAGYEFKWGKGKVKKQKDFLSAYPGSSIQLVNRENFLEFVK
ncbi:MAG: ATP-binding protein [Thermoleophilia bacterium]